MSLPAPKKIQVLITNAGSYLGAQLAQSLLLENCQVYAQGNSPQLSSLLSKDTFTLIEFNTGQPFPSYLPQFDLVFHLDQFQKNVPSFSTGSGSPAVRNIIRETQGKSEIFILAPLTADSDYIQNLESDQQTKKFLHLFLIGDLYGPKMPISEEGEIGPAQTTLADLISQALTSDKIVLPNEGLKMIYPAYIADVIFAINKFVFSKRSKDVQVIVSQDPKTSLSVAYEIQNIVSVVSGKNLGLFFSGPQPSHIDMEPVMKTHELDFTPKIELNEGLTKTFQYLWDENLIKPKTQSSPHSIKQFHQELPPIEPTAHKISSSKKFLTSKIQSVPHLRFRARTFLFIFLAILVLTLGKTSFDIYRGINNLKSAKEALTLGDFKKAKNKSDNAHSSLRVAARQFGILSLPLKIIFPKKIASFQNSLVASSIGAGALGHFAQGSQILTGNLAVLTAKNTTDQNLDLETPLADFKRAYFEASLAQSLAKEAQVYGLFKSQIQKAQDSFDNLCSYSSSILELVSLTDDFIGAGDDKTYLVLLQNNNELRPGGGFIGNFATIEFSEGKLKNITVEDIYTIDGQLQEKVEPPKQLTEKLGLSQLYLRDSNWSPDFRLNAQTARDFFKKETGKNVDGVIAVDLTFVQNILAKTGSIKLEDFKNEEITDKNLFEKGEYFSEVGFFPGSTQKKDFFAALTRALVERILGNLQSQSSWLPLIEASKDALSQKHFMLFLDNPDLSTFITARGWDQPMPPANFNVADDSAGTMDFLALSEANLGANKVNHFLERKVNYEMTIGRDADLVAKLTINYTNNSQAETWPAGKYVNYLRVYVPFAAGLFEFKNGDNTDLNSVEVTLSGGLTTFGTYVEVPIKSTKQVTFTYRIPKNIKLETAPYYHLYVQKQPGTITDPLEFAFNLPAYLKVKSVSSSSCNPKPSSSVNCEAFSDQQNLNLKTDLSIDREFEIEVIKK